MPTFVSATMTVNATATSASMLIGFLEILAHENEFSYKLMQLTKWIKEDRSLLSYNHLHET